MSVHQLTGLFSLKGKTALITGSSRGIGIALACGLGQAGARVLINGRNADTVQAVVDELNSQSIAAKALIADVTKQDDITAKIDDYETNIGPIDILINNAGMQHRQPLEHFDSEIFDQMIAVNLKAAFYTSKALSTYMIARQHGRIINIASVMSLLARPGIAPYTATKGAIANLTKGMAADWAGYGLNCNAIAPGYFKTELNAALVADQQFTAWLEERTPAGRWGDVSDLVGTAVYLAAPASSFVNGQIIYVDGGLTATV
ncbi:MAG: gluconate 5-dehydrogenase [Rhodospirillaceae bacterium]|nr:gluconate 5-dehydrogenase [Rhodospirillaceae bacterium]